MIVCAIVMIVGAVLLTQVRPPAAEQRGVFDGQVEEYGKVYIREKLPNGDILMRLTPRRY